MLKTKRIFSMGSKSTSATCQKIWPFLVRQRKDKRKETRLSELHPVGPSAIRSFLRASLFNKHALSTNNNDPESFHCAIGPILLLAQLFGVLPVSGIRKPSPFRLKFVKFSFRTAYAAFTTMIALVMAIVSVIHMIRTIDSTMFEVQGGIKDATAGAIFYVNGTMELIVFLWLSPHWVTLQRDWRAMEQFIDSNKVDRPKLRWKFYAIAASILTLAVIEHILSIVVITAEEHNWSGETENSTFANFLKIYCTSSHAFILDTLKYNFTFGILIFIVSNLTTFTWNFTDVFIMLISTGLAERYKILNKQVTTSVLKHRTIDWSELREDYAALACMVKKVDGHIAPIILLSFANNLYFICLQLLNGLSQPKGTVLGDAYYFGSFFILIGRTVTVTLLTARINDQSKVILPTLYTCSASSYNVETERLIYQLTTDEVALTGMRFFSITRNFMLAVAGAIVTYEVILLQFSVATRT